MKTLALGLPKKAWRTITWREGTNKKLRSRFGRVQVRTLSAAIVIGAVILSAGTAHAVELNPAAVIYKLPNQIEWKGTGGNRSAVLVGDPEKPGLYIGHVVGWYRQQVRSLTTPCL